MGYPRTLDEIPERELLLEIAKRIRLRSEGKCDYCEQGVDRPPCKFPERHRQPAGNLR